MRRREFLAGLLSAPATAPLLGAAQFNSRQSGTWVIESGKLSRVFRLDQARGIALVSLKNPASGFEWAVPDYCDFAFAALDLQSEGLGPHSGFRFTGQQSRTLEKGSKELRLDFLHQKQALKLSLFYTSFPGTSVFEQRCRLENVGKNNIPEVSRFDPVLFTVRGPIRDLQVHSVRRSQYALQRLPIGENLEIRGGGWNAPEHAGFVAIESLPDREFLFLGIEWERDWGIRLEKHPTGVRISAGIVEFKHDLKPGDSLESPRVFVGLGREDLDATCRAMFDYLSGYVFPSKPANFPWVVYDIWGTEKENVESMVLQEIDFAANLGIEHFYIDASWYEGSSKRGTGDWGFGLGRYRDDREKYPRGLAHIASQVHQKGMKFGLWVDPVVVDQQLVPKEIPHQWVGQKDGRDNILRIPDWTSPVVHICLGNPEVVEHLKANLSRIVTEFHLDWLKWDNSGLPGQPTVCNREDHGHQKGDGSYVALRGAYAIWEHLHRTHPDLVLEQCGYGSRHDYGLARFCRANWLSDASYPSGHVRENTLTASYLYPSSYNGAWIVLDPEVQKQKDPGRLDTMYRIRMMGLFGFGTLTGKLLTERVSLYPQEVLNAARRNIPIYKRLRHLLAEDCYHLTPPFGSAERWQVVQFCQRDGSEAVVFAFRGTSTQGRYLLRLRGLKPENHYSVRSENLANETIRSGRELAQDGIIVELAKVDLSELLMLRAM